MDTPTTKDSSSSLLLKFSRQKFPCLWQLERIRQRWPTKVLKISSIDRNSIHSSTCNIRNSPQLTRCLINKNTTPSTRGRCLKLQPPSPQCPMKDRTWTSQRQTKTTRWRKEKPCSPNSMTFQSTNSTRPKATKLEILTTKNLQSLTRASRE